MGFTHNILSYRGGIGTTHSQKEVVSPPKQGETGNFLILMEAKMS